jgi:hypothetical protein
MKGGYMIKDKRGLSAIITTLLIVLLVLVAVGIVWAVVSGILNRGAEDLELSAKCLNIDVRASAVLCATGVCNVTFDRTGTGTDAIGGVKLVFRNSTAGTNSGVIDSDDVTELGGDIEHLAGEIVTDIDTTLTAPDSVEVTVYFMDASGNAQLCDAQTTTKTF